MQDSKAQARLNIMAVKPDETDIHFIRCELAWGFAGKIYGSPTYCWPHTKQAFRRLFEENPAQAQVILEILAKEDLHPDQVKYLRRRMAGEVSWLA